MKDTEFIIDKKGFIEWLQIVAGFAFSDLSKSIKDGNIDAARANLEKIEMLENIAPWLGEMNCHLEIKLAYVEKKSKIDMDFLEDKLPF